MFLLVLQKHISLAMFFLGLVIANEIAWRTLDDDGWVTFKVLFVAPATGLFMLAQLPATMRGRIEPGTQTYRKDNTTN